MFLLASNARQQQTGAFCCLWGAGLTTQVSSLSTDCLSRYIDPTDNISSPLQSFPGWQQLTRGSRKSVEASPSGTFTSLRAAMEHTKQHPLLQGLVNSERRRRVRKGENCLTLWLPKLRAAEDKLLTTHSHIKSASQLSIQTGSQAAASGTTEGEGHTLRNCTLWEETLSTTYIWCPPALKTKLKPNVQAVHIHLPSASHNFIDAISSGTTTAFLLISFILTFINSWDQNSSLGMFLLIQLDMKLVKNSSSFTKSYTGTQSEQNRLAVFVLPRLKLVCPGCTFRQRGRLGSTKWKHEVPKTEKMSFEERTPSAFLHPCKKCLKWNSLNHAHTPPLHSPPKALFVISYLYLY